MRKPVRQCLDLVFVQRIGDLGHGRHAAARTHTALVVLEGLEQVVLALAGDPATALVPAKVSVWQDAQRFCAAIFAPACDNAGLSSAGGVAGARKPAK